jgi:hypothetical protein
MIQRYVVFACSRALDRSRRVFLGEEKFMPKPPPATPHSDIEGVNRDARAGRPSKATKPEPAGLLKRAKEDSKGRPKGDEDDMSQPPR